ncbi:hypothetical protein ACSYAD_10995 [Acaryochloris marina NIES-2412]|uniref:hypothetical protein n=1 Tax=Acaryochloris marina TaxID=155978 RepID=UPI00405851BE
MIISDLNYCEVMTEGLEDVSGGSFRHPRFRFQKVHTKFVGIVVKPFIKGNTAKAGATSDAFGNNSFTETTTSTTVSSGYGSSSSSNSVAVTS